MDPAYRSKGVATDLIRRSVLLAGTMGFTGLMTEATGAFSQKAFRRLGNRSLDEATLRLHLLDTLVLEEDINWRNESNVRQNAYGILEY